MMHFRLAHMKVSIRKCALKMIVLLSVIHYANVAQHIETHLLHFAILCLIVLLTCRKSCCWLSIALIDFNSLIKVHDWDRKQDFSFLFIINYIIIEWQRTYERHRIPIKINLFLNCLVLWPQRNSTRNIVSKIHRKHIKYINIWTKQETML